jgi:hypothetical protein
MQKAANERTDLAGIWVNLIYTYSIKELTLLISMFIMSRLTTGNYLLPERRSF